MRVLIILGHPRPDSLSGSLAEAFAEGAAWGGAEVHLLRVSDLEFGPDVTHPAPARQQQEPDLERARRLLLWAEHLVFVYPTWWGTAPAALKGFLDRVLLPGFAFREEEDGRFLPLLGGRTAELVTTMDTPRWVYRWIYGAPGHRALARATLGFCGIEPVRLTSFGPVHTSSDSDRRSWLRRARALGLRLRHGPRTGGQRARRWVCGWAGALRLHFYPFTVGGYLVGSWMAADGGALDRPAFWLGLLLIVSLKAATVLTNDIFDHESDRRNRNWGPFSGGSRRLVDGRLTRRAMGGGAALALGLSAMAGWGVLAHTPGSRPVVLVAMTLLAVLALGYTVPPLKLSHRGLGEVDVAVTHSVGVVLVGWLVQGGAWDAGYPWALSLLVGLAVLPAIILAGIPDRSADASVGKRTLAVYLGTRGAAGLALVAVLVAALAPRAISEGSTLSALLGWLPLVAGLHGVILGAMLVRYLRRGAPEGRIDGLIATALLFMVWFVALPALGLA